MSLGRISLFVLSSACALLGCRVPALPPPEPEVGGLQARPAQGSPVDDQVRELIASFDWVAAREGQRERLGPYFGPEELHGQLVEELDAIGTGVRVAAAVLLSRSGRPGWRELLEGQLDAGDITMRRVVAELLFDYEALRPDVAERYRYERALAAEERLARLASRIRTGDLMQQFRATQEIVELGRPALWGLQRLIREGDPVVALSAAYAQCQIAFTPTEWRKRYDEILVTLDFSDLSLAEAARRLARQTGVEVRVSPSLRDFQDAAAFQPAVPLKVDGMPLPQVLGWVRRVYDIGDPAIGEDGVVLHPPSRWDGSLGTLIDVRDINASGPGVDWPMVVDQAYREDAAADFLAAWELMFPRLYLDGFLYMVPPTHQEWPDGEACLTPVRDRLCELRKERGLPQPVGEPAPDLEADWSLRSQHHP